MHLDRSRVATSQYRMGHCLILLLFVSIIFSFSFVSVYAEEEIPTPESSKGVTTVVEADKENCLECHTSKKETKVSKLIREKPSPFINRKAYLETAHFEQACTDCHIGYTNAVERRVRTQFGKLEYKVSHTEEEFKNYAKEANEACGREDCHPGPQRDFLRGSHSQQIAKTEEELPTCTTCHNFHYIPDFLKKTKEGKVKISAKTKIDFSEQICGSCHREALETYEGNYHYKALKLGNAEAPMCDDCHGGHKAKPLKAGTADAVVACKKCHDDANKNFTLYIVHLDPISREAPPEVLYVNLFYLGLTILIVCMGVLHTTVLSFRRRAERRAKESRR